MQSPIRFTLRSKAFIPKNGVKLYNVQDVLVNVRGGSAMSARRGGWKYAKSEIRFQRKILQMGLISLHVFLRNVPFFIILAHNQ